MTGFESECDVLLATLRNGDWSAVETAIRGVEDSNKWPCAMQKLPQIGALPKERLQQLHKYWHTRGHKIREQVSNDSAILRALPALLPTYEGPGMTLYRGENLDRWLTGRIGFAWTPLRSVAEMFARGLQAVKSGGVLLSTTVSPQAIIAGPSEHSERWLGEHEYTVDTHYQLDIQELGRYSIPVPR